MRERKVRFVVSETHFIKESVANHPDIFKNFRVVGEEGQITALELIN